VCRRKGCGQPDLLEVACVQACPDGDRCRGLPRVDLLRWQRCRPRPRLRPDASNRSAAAGNPPRARPQVGRGAEAMTDGKGAGQGGQQGFLSRTALITKDRVRFRTAFRNNRSCPVAQRLPMKRQPVTDSGRKDSDGRVRLSGFGHNPGPATSSQGGGSQEPGWLAVRHAEGLFGSMVRQITALPVPAG
jgi:hypothetical protein